MPVLQHLNVEDNNLGDAAISTLCHGIRKCPSLMRLVLRSNKMTSRGAEVQRGGVSVWLNSAVLT